ncbi:MAG TPA: hypothetical protein VFG53_03580 [Anaeromyxobacter sp.]|nr:hypothetical protein [Anaeromyxobacter sp.]
MNVLVTGRQRLHGSNLIQLMKRERPDWRLVVLDKLTCAGNAQSLAEFEEGPR